MRLDDTFSQKNPFISDALEAVKLKFVNTIDEMQLIREYNPQFAHQHFGESEKILGYKNLDVLLYYSAASMFLYPEIKYEKKIQTSDIEPDDILHKLREQLPMEQMDMMVLDIVAFKKKLEEQKKFYPFGEVIGVVRQENKEYRIYKVSKYDGEFGKYITRIQTLALWYIDAAEYTDVEDERFFHYLMYEVSQNTEDGRDSYRLMGYATLYNFYVYPEFVRPRIAQILIFPQFRGTGAGAKFLTAIYTDLRKDPTVKDITAETPADTFIYLRDYVDCVDCKELKSFEKENLLKGWNIEMANEAQTILKIHPKQARRVFEILRLYYTDTGDAVEVDEYKSILKARLERPLKRSQNDWNKLRQALNDEEFRAVAVSDTQENKQEILEQLYQKVYEEYQVVIGRLKTYAGF